MMKYLSLACATLLFSLPACQSPTPPTGRWALATVRYLEDNQELRGQLLLYEGDSLPTAQPLRFPGQVSFLGSGMEETVLPGPTPDSPVYRYQTTLRTAYPTELRFSFPGPDTTNAERRTVDFRMVAPDLATFPDTIDRAAGVRFTTAADSLGSTENILLFFTNTTDGSVRRVLVTGPTRSNRITVPAPALQQVDPGTYRLYLIKSQRTDGRHDNLRTQGLVEYYTREKVVLVE